MRRVIPLLVLFASLLAVVLGFGYGCRPSGQGSVGGGIAWVWNDLPKGEALAAANHKKILLYFGAGY